MIAGKPAAGREKIILVGLEREGVSRWDLEDSMEELVQLADTAGAEVVGRVVQRLERPTAPFYIGSGKALEVARDSRQKGATSVVFDDELTPAQSRNLEEATACKVIDRTQLILDIFASRARTREGRLQIELAQLQYLLPRLTRMWTHLSRQTGGIGTRGPGETQLEVDRRRVQDRIARLERDLAEVRKNRGVQREGRMRHNWPCASLVGYTNAGKSSLLNRLTGAGVAAEDRLFETLDPTTRHIVLPNHQKVLLTDTVGFIRKLPHTLIESFKSTLEEVSLAHLLLHVVDISHPRHTEQIESVNAVLAELGAEGKQTIMVFNKCDLAGEGAAEGMLARYPGSVAVSARTGEGFDALIEEIQVRLAAWRMRGRYRIPLQQQALIAEIHRVGHVLDISYENDFAVLMAHIPPELAGRLAAHEATAS
jgi:GTP-binding protein HflX